MGIKIRIKNTTLEVEYLVIITIIISCISKAVRSYFLNYYICILFIVYHESSHIFVATILNRELKKITISISGLTAYFKYDYKPKNRKYYVKSIIIFLAGPISNLLMAVLFKNIKFIYEINMFLALLNLFPIYPLDGFNILKSILYLVFKNNQSIVNYFLRTLSLFFLIIYIAILLIIFICYKNVTSIIFASYILLINLKNG